MDYRRFPPAEATLAVLLPEEPPPWQRKENDASSKGYVEGVVTRTILAVHRASVMLAGFGGAAALAALGALVFLPTADVLTLVAWGAAIGAPLLGMILSLNVNRWWPLWFGFGVGAVALVVEYSFVL